MIETKTQRAARLSWWRHARFGLFIHWGVYAVPGGLYQGRREPYYSEWLMLRAKIPCAEYRTYADAFTARDFDPRAWVAAAKRAGMGYLVITTKHHDGFALFDSAVNEWNVVDATPYQRDALRELVDACREQDMPIGFYYSQAQDWMNGGSASGGHWDSAQQGEMSRYVDEVVIPHLDELLTNYGPDVPSMLWWDTPVGMNEALATRIEKHVRTLRPDIIMNNRLYQGHTADILTPEQRIPAHGYPGRDWETCMTMNNTWGFAHEDQEWKSSKVLIHNLIDIVSKGGNYLLNVGPDAQGRIPGKSLELLAEMGDWMQANGESIVGASGFTPDEPVPWARFTQKANILYCHILEWPEKGRCRIPIPGSVLSVSLLAMPSLALGWERLPDGIDLQLPEHPVDAAPAVVAIRLKVPPAASPLPLNRPDSTGTLQLPAASAELFDTTDSERIPSAVLGGKEATLTYWKNVNEACRWRLASQRSGIYRVRLHYAVAPQDSGSRFSFRVADQAIEGIIPQTDSWLDYQWRDIGSIRIEVGTNILATFGPTALATANGFLNLKMISLVPEME